MTKFYLSILRQIASISVIFLIVLVNIDKSVAQPVLTFTPFATGLGPALEIVNAGDGSNRLFIAQRNGTIRVHDGTTLLPTPFINLADTVLDNGEQGLLSLAFHPDYETNRYFFVWYTDKEGDLTLARYQTTAGDPNIADQNSEVVLLEIPKPGTPYFMNHNGGKIAFGTDGYLYVSIGDGGSGGDPFNNAQNGNLLFGKMLRSERK
jgi:glucose/arabinose dehydrogenase